MAKYNLVTIRPPGFLHSSASSDIRDSMAWSLSALGHEVITTDNGMARGATNIVFCSELLTPGASLPSNSIIYNLEQPTHPNMGTVRALARDQTVWDYSPSNIQDWKTHGIEARHLPIGYTPNLTRIPKSDPQDIDVFFAGWLTPRRRTLIDSLKALGLKLYVSDTCYGGARDQILSRSKLCLNINHDGRTLFNMARVSFLLANSKAVISETGSDDEVYRDQLGGAMAWFDYKEIVDRTIYLLRNPAPREGLEINSLDAIKKLDFTESLAKVLNPSLSPTSSPILLRYQKGLEEGDMKDFLPWIRSHAKGNILEIGTRDGASTSAFLLGLVENDPQGHLTSLDVADCSHLWNHPQWSFHRANSLTVQFPDDFFDIVLIDGDHSQASYRGDLYNAFHWTKPGGLILSHDITPERGHEFYAVGIREEWDKFLRVHPELKHQILPGRYGLGVMEKPL